MPKQRKDASQGTAQFMGGIKKKSKVAGSDATVGDAQFGGGAAVARPKRGDATVGAGQFRS